MRDKSTPKLERPIEWVGSSLKDLIAFPAEVKRVIGYALRKAQLREMHEDAKTMKGELRDVIEIVADDERGERTFRVTYCVKLGDVVYVLHAFCKKSRKGIQTSKADLALIAQRLRTAKADHEEKYGKGKK